MSIRNLIFGVKSVTVSDLIPYDSLLQNATDVIKKATDVITKSNSYFMTKLDNFITKCDSYYKMGRLLQIATVK